MNRLFSQYWWLFLLRGFFALIIGLLALSSPVLAFAGLVLFLGAYMLVDGLFSIIAAISERKTAQNWSWMLYSGIFSLFIGLLTFLNPFATATAVVYLLAFWALVMGIAEIVLGIRLRHAIKGEGWYIAAGIFTILFSLVVLFFPVVGAWAFVVLFGSYAVVIGILLMVLGFRLRRRRDRTIPLSSTNRPYAT